MVRSRRFVVFTLTATLALLVGAVAVYYVAFSPEPPPPAPALSSVPLPTVTKRTFESVTDVIEVSASYPEFSLPGDPEGVINLNAAVAEILDSEIGSVLDLERDALEYDSRAHDQNARPDSVEARASEWILRPHRVFIGYSVSLLSPTLVSVDFGIVTRYAGSDLPISGSTSLIYSIVERRILDPSELFLPDSAYLEFLSTYARAQLPSAVESTGPCGDPCVLTDAMLRATKPVAHNFQNLSVSLDGISMYFSVSSVEAYGPAAVTIPFSELTHLLNPAYFPLSPSAVYGY